ncbi:phosphodiester glycosidase family protein [Cohnella yongneupensis]|uniref:Phosphodiester glycosidase family protein n=1 Tax=Cohnella yongneupensis TaxID=425006 RepID=A0ABW0R108_9BACL
MSAIGVRGLNRTMLLACAPFVGLLAWLAIGNVAVSLTEEAFPQHAATNIDPAALSGNALNGLAEAESSAAITGKMIKRQLQLYNQTNADMKKIASMATAQSSRPYQIYDKRITGKLGKPAATINTDKLRAQLFYLSNENFSSYALKVQLKDEDAMKLVLAEDKPGKAETTLNAVKRSNASIGVNAGGFADSRAGRFPLSTTIVDGEYVGSFQASYKDLFFVGMSANNKLIGGKFGNQSELDALKPKFGASFVPVLLENGRKTSIPAKWQSSPRRAPRTVVASYKDDQLLFIVADGYNEHGSSGATLEEMQSLLKRYGAIDGYNLDGGGSSTLVWGGRVINHPSDGSLRKLPTNFVFFK